ncbi:VanZ family protein [Thalassotalea ganghwensis]
MRILIILVYLLIAYGSLFPFDFSFIEFNQEYKELLSLDMPGIGDILGNILLFTPLGLLYYLTENKAKSKFYRFSLWGKVLLFATCLQVAQIAIPERDQNIIDVLFNLIGFYVGIISVTYFEQSKLIDKLSLRLLPLGIAALFFTSELIPLIPSLDWQSFKDSIKPLFVTYSWTKAADIILDTIVWCIIIRLMFSKIDRESMKQFLLIWLAFLGSKLVIYTNTLDLSNFVSPVLAILLSKRPNFFEEKSTKILLVFFVLAISYASMASLGANEFSAQTFIPFSGYLNGQLQYGVQEMLFKLFAYSSIIWLAFELGINARKVALFLAIWTLIVEFLQLFMPQRVTDLGDVLLVYVAYLAVRHIGDYLATIESKQDGSLKIAKANDKQFTVGFDSKQKFFLWSAFGFIVYYLTVKAFLGLPDISYNIAELFQHDGSILDLLFFWLFILLFLGGQGIAAKVDEDTTIAKYVVMQLICLFTMFSFLALAVTSESIEDIVGSSKLYQAVYFSQTSESFLAMLANVLSLSVVANILKYIEFFVRGASLLSLFYLPLTLSYLFFSRKLSYLTIFKYLLVTGLLYCLAFYVVFIDAITDNVTELIVNPYALGVGILIFTLSIGWQWLLIKESRKTLAIIILLATSILSWYITPVIFEQKLVKYGYTYSALDFLIGYGRESVLDGNELLIRWIVLIFAVQALLHFVACYWGKVPKNLFWNKSNIKQVLKYIFYILSVWIVLYISNRLFGEHLHWQTVQQFFSTPDSLGYEIDKSKANKVQVEEPGKIFLNGKLMANLSQAFNQAKANDFIKITQGHYRQAGVLRADNVSIIGEAGVIIFGATKEGKGALVIKGDNTYIEGIECHSIYVPDNNGVCVRLEGKGITLNNVYFHHAQGGFLGSSKGGDIRIENSRFEHLGDGAFYHGLYSLSPTRLFISNSYFLNTRNGGHEIKTRSKYTEITHSVIASSQSRDSRLIDVPNGGSLVLKNNVLIEGVFSENHDLLSWGVEGITHEPEIVEIEGNTIISDKSRARLINLQRIPKKFRVENNIIVGKILGIDEKDNVIFKNRAELSIPPAPFILNSEFKKE